MLSITVVKGICFKNPYLRQYLLLLCFMKGFWFVLMVLFAAPALAQQPSVIQLMNGKRLEVYRIDDSTQVNITYVYDKNFFKKERINIKTFRNDPDQEGNAFSSDYSTPKADEIPIVKREGSVARDEVFSIIKPDGTEELVYFYDEPLGNYMTEEEMRAFVYGERDARYGVTAKGWFYAGMGVGLAGGYLLETSVWSLAIPPVFMLSTKIPVVKINDDHISDKSYRYNENYALGYESHKRSKSAIEALKGGAVGTVLGILAFIVVDNNR